MCNLSEGVWEKAEAKGLAKGRAEGKISQLTSVVEKMMSKGMNFDEIINFLDITPDNASEVKA